MDIHEKTVKIIKDFGFTGRGKIPEVLGISYSLFNNKLSDKSRNKFSEKNYKDLVNWLKDEVKKL
ncbi:hypothetical protein [Mesonia aestuariivivens]|uniref:Uncharacterized protein n=1 Tax=Mesonia aestuariivivens TaxID=2796128 RepID=A0ABS6W5B7_9FLAO|nr:hypothetical protein [Mesonia aestuariivivens]MBW2962323.1 hypothetical protein [Mesonia aestuariivivens]